MPPPNTTINATDLPVIEGIAYRNELSKQTIRTLLTAYNIPFTGNVKSKKRAIARALGMVSVADKRYLFSNTYGTEWVII